MSLLVSPDPALLIAFALNLLLPLTVVGLLALVAARWVFRRDPSVRYAICLAGLLCILLSPLVVCVQCRLGYGLVTLSLPRYFSLDAAPEAPVSPAHLVDAGTNIRIHPASLPPKRLIWGVWAGVSVWGLGVAWGIVRLAHGWRQIARLTKGLRPWRAASDSETLARLEGVLASSLPPIFTSSRVVSPVVVGLLCPAVILPEGLTERLSPAQLRQVLLHECAHVVFRHTFGGMVERVAGALFWPHPLVHALCHELARAREEVCDNVASQEEGAACYARTLLAIAQGIETAPNITSALALQGPGTSLEERIAGLLDPRRNRMARMKRWKLWAVTGAAVLALGSTVVVRVVASETKAKQDAVKASEDSREAKLRAEAAEAINARAKEIMAASHVSDQEAHKLAEDEYAATHHLPPAKPPTAAELQAHRKAEAEYLAKHTKASANQSLKPVMVKTNTRGTFVFTAPHAKPVLVHAKPHADNAPDAEELADIVPDDEELAAKHKAEKSGKAPTGQHAQPSDVQASEAAEREAKAKAEAEAKAKAK